MKKISVALIIILLFNFICCSFAYATPENDTGSESSAHFNMSSFHQADEEGTVDIEGNTKEINVTQSVIGAILGIIMSIVVMPIEGISALANSLFTLGGYYHTDSEFGAIADNKLKVSSIIFGEFFIFDVGITKTAASLNSEIEPGDLTQILDNLKESTVGLFEILRAVALGIFLILILVTAIRLALSNIAEDRARFKALILDWFIGLMFTFFAKYFVLLFNIILDVVMEALWMARLELEAANSRSFEFSMYGFIYNVLVEAGGMQFFAYGILYIVLFIVTMKFAIRYLFRVFKVFFLVVTSPIVGIVYTLQRASSENSNAIGEWMKSYASNLMIQPIHAITYLIFMFTANEIAINAPFLGIVFLWALERAEKIIKAILGINDNVYVVGK